MNQCRLCPYLRAQQGQMHRAEPTDITRGAKAKTPQSLLPTVGKGRKGKDKGKGKYGGGASQPTTYQGGPPGARAALAAAAEGGPTGNRKAAGRVGTFARGAGADPGR